MKRATNHTHEKSVPVRIGMRMTKSRKEIIELISRAHTPLTIQELAGLASSNEASVYRTIKLLQEEGHLHEIHYPNGMHRYELGAKHHDHVICSSCGHTEHIACALTALAPLQIPHFKEIRAHEVTYYGLCTKCA